MNSESSQWQYYLASLSGIAAQELQKRYLNSGERISRPRLADALYRLLSSEAFLRQAGAELQGFERCIMATLCEQPCSFERLLMRLPFSATPLQLGLALASLRSRLLLASLEGCYFVPTPIQLGLDLGVADLIISLPAATLPPAAAPWLSEGLLLAAASFYLQGKSGAEAIFGKLLSAPRQEQLLALLQQLALLVNTPQGYRPLLPPPELLRMNHQQRLWFFWGRVCDLSDSLLYRILWPLRQLPPFERRSWQGWLYRFASDLPAQQHQRLTSLLLQLNLLVETTLGDGLAVNPLLAQALALKEQFLPLRLPATLEFHLSVEELRLELAPLTFCCQIKHFDSAAVLRLSPPLFQRLLAAMGPQSGFEYWLAWAKEAQVSLEELALQQLQLLHQDGQRARFWAAVPVLICENSLGRVVEQLPGLARYLLLPPRDGVFIFDPHNREWQNILQQAGLKLEDSRPAPTLTKPELPSDSNWPPLLNKTEIIARPPDTLLSSLSFTFAPYFSSLRQTSGLNYHAKKQLLQTLIDNGEQLAEITYLGMEGRALIVLPLALGKNQQGYTLEAHELSQECLIYLDVGKMLHVRELRYALLSEPLRQQLLHCSTANDSHKR